MAVGKASPSGDADPSTNFTVLRCFGADLCGIVTRAANPRDDGYSSNGSDERAMAYAYYERLGYRWRNAP